MNSSADQTYLTEIGQLTQFFERLAVHHVFQPGDLVTWKPGLRNKLMPAKGQPGIVIEKLAEPVMDDAADADSPYYREPLDIAVGVVDADDDVLVYWFDSRRMQPLPPLDPPTVARRGGR